MNYVDLISPFSLNVISPILFEGKNNIFKAFLFGTQLTNPQDMFLFESVLHPNERKRYDNFPSQLRKTSYLIGRYSAKKAIEGMCDINQLSDIEIKSGVFYQPVLLCKKITNVKVSISHTKNIGMALAFPETFPVSIDIELINKNHSQAMKTILDQDEQNLFQKLDIDLNLFYTILWTAKESISKVINLGFTSPPSMYKVNSIKQKKKSEFQVLHSNFPQFKTWCCLRSSLIVSITYPKKFNMESIIK